MKTIMHNTSEINDITREECNHFRQQMTFYPLAVMSVSKVFQRMKGKLCISDQLITQFKNSAYVMYIELFSLIMSTQQKTLTEKKKQNCCCRNHSHMHHEQSHSFLTYRSVMKRMSKTRGMFRLYDLFVFQFNQTSYGNLLQLQQI